MEANKGSLKTQDNKVVGSPITDLIKMVKNQIVADEATDLDKQTKYLARQSFSIRVTRDNVSNILTNLGIKANNNIEKSKNIRAVETILSKVCNSKVSEFVASTFIEASVISKN